MFTRHDSTEDFRNNDILYTGCLIAYQKNNNTFTELQL